MYWGGHVFTITLVKIKGFRLHLQLCAQEMPLEFSAF